MQFSQEYVEGFCKAAEAYGVDPEDLLKAAAGIPWEQPIQTPQSPMRDFGVKLLKRLRETPINAQTGENAGNAFAKSMNRFVTQGNEAVSNMNNFVTGVTNGFQKAIQKTPVVHPNAAELDRLDKNVQGVTSGRLFDALGRIYQPK